MNLNKYLQRIIEGEKELQTPSTIEIPRRLEIPSYLKTKIKDTLKYSEDKGKEMGFNLFYENNEIRPIGPKRPGYLNNIYEGSYNTVNLNTNEVLEIPAYIGDFHTHPYSKRYGCNNIAIGPSFGDWQAWSSDLEKIKNKVALFMVASGKDLFLLLTITATSGKKLNHQNEGMDLKRIWEISNNFTRNGTLAKECAIHIKSQELLASGDPSVTALEKYAKFVKKYWPTIPEVHSEDTHTMNINLANDLGWAYYRGSLSFFNSRVNLCSKPIMMG